MPSYLTDILDFDLGSAGIFCIFPYLALFFSTLLFARGFDYMQREKSWEVNTVRVTAMFITYMGSALGLIVCGFLDAKYAAYTFMVLTQVTFYVFLTSYLSTYASLVSLLFDNVLCTQVFYAAAQSGLGCIWSDVAPLYSSSLNSLGKNMGRIVYVHLIVVCVSAIAPCMLLILPILSLPVSYFHIFYLQPIRSARWQELSAPSWCLPLSRPGRVYGAGEWLFYSRGVCVP